MGTAIVIVIIVVICVFAIYSYGHKMRHGGGCCGSHEAAEKKVKVADKNTATVTITGLPDTVTYGQEFTLTASQTGDTTSANKKWTWDDHRRNDLLQLLPPGGERTE